MKLNNHVISLTTASQRREHISHEFGKHCIDFEFFDAVTPNQLSSLAEKFQINISHDTLTKGEYACLFSHLCLWQKMIDNNDSHIGIFEDDVHLGEHADQFLSNSDWIIDECRLIKLEHFFDKLMLAKAIHHHQHRSIRQLKQANLGTAGYIIHQDMAKALINYVQESFKHQAKPIDHLMFECFLSREPSLKVYQLTPALCIQSDRLPNHQAINSDLEKERQQNRLVLKGDKAKLSFAQKVKREGKRLMMQAHHLVFSSNIEFK
ncbi:glycosyltransferase family 25 protein [Moraxella sp. Tifton1]|uniref:glycosyltransferase family 25 protein n=1 Tax=Moraxella oculi TaxID=2940516 RepID=UPI00201173BA|nr:glycosyltransferase family 25 protein [Moraxella sp. Tifton1]MCL1622716.1 glycosyltransferase family 25 protein [Moraxella sp. Tifton1]